MRITNLQKNAAIAFNANSKFIITFDADNSTTEEWALGTTSQVTGINIKHGQINLEHPVGEMEWTLTGLTSLDGGNALELDISEIVTAHPNGLTNMYVRYENIPGYWDGLFICPIEKAPLLFSGQNVGIGTTAPRSQLSVSGGVGIGSGYAGTNAAPTNGLLVEGQVGIGTTAPRSKLSVSGGVGIGSGYAGTNAAPSNGLLVEGKVGIGTTAPRSKLIVVCR